MPTDAKPPDTPSAITTSTYKSIDLSPEPNVLKDSNAAKPQEDEGKLLQMAHIRLNLSQQKDQKPSDYTPKYIPPPDLEKDVERMVQSCIGNLHLTVNNLESQVSKLMSASSRVTNENEPSAPPTPSRSNDRV